MAGVRCEAGREGGSEEGWAGVVGSVVVVVVFVVVCAGVRCEGGEAALVVCGQGAGRNVWACRVVRRHRGCGSSRSQWRLSAAGSGGARR